MIADSDIGTPVPTISEAIFAQIDWFYVTCQLCRLMSRTYESFFSISAISMTPKLIHESIEHLLADLEQWRVSIPDDFRPGKMLIASKFSDRTWLSSTLRLHFQYHSLVIALSRLTLSLNLGESSRATMESRRALLNAARMIVDLTRYIEVEAYTPIWLDKAND